MILYYNFFDIFLWHLLDGMGFTTDVWQLTPRYSWLATFHTCAPLYNHQCLVPLIKILHLYWWAITPSLVRITPYPIGGLPSSIWKVITFGGFHFSNHKHFYFFLFTIVKVVLFQCLPEIFFMIPFNQGLVSLIGDLLPHQILAGIFSYAPLTSFNPCTLGLVRDFIKKF